MQAKTFCDKDLPVKCTDVIMDRFLPDACADTGNIKIRSYDCRSTADRSIKRSGCRIYIFPGNSGNVWCQSLKLIKFGFHFTGAEFGLLMLGCIVSFGLSVIAIKFLMGYIKQHDFKVFGYYRIVLGGLIIVWTIIQTVIA